MKKAWPVLIMLLAAIPAMGRGVGADDAKAPVVVTPILTTEQEWRSGTERRIIDSITASETLSQLIE